MVRLAIGFIGNALTYIMPAKAAKWGGYVVFALIVALALYLAYAWAWDRGRDDERARWEAAAAKIEAADAKADAAGTVTAAETKGKVDAEVEKAREAARQSGDPLGAVADSLRAKGSGKGN
jgi:hypothetical protein